MNIVSAETYIKKHGSYFENFRREMLAFVPLSAKNILEIGCGNGAFGSIVKQRQQTRYIGIDLANTPLQIAQTRLDIAIQADIENKNDALPFSKDEFDCIICNDVLEHLRDPWASLDKLCGYLTLGGYLVASIPNVRYFEVMKELLIHRLWRYQEEGVLDRTHLRFFTDRTIRNLFEQAGLQIVTLQGIHGGAFPWKFGFLNCLLLNALDDMRYERFL